MGHTIWSDRAYRRNQASRKRKGRSAFGHNDDIRQRKVAARVHPLMDPAKINGVREARDGEVHSDSHAVTVLFDVTGSMHRVPRILQANLCRLFGMLQDQQYLADPAILVGGIGDATCDIAPLQLGQFESGNEVEDDLSRLFLEGGGGGQQTESYELALYFLARKTAIDCYEKRGRKGYAFIIGDEMPYKSVKQREVKAVFGDHIKQDIPVRDILAEAQEKFEVFFILPNLTSYYDDPRILDHWRSLLGQHVLRLHDPDGICELIASTIGVAEEAISYGAVEDELKQHGVDSKISSAVSQAFRDAKASPASVKGTGLQLF